MNNLSSSRLLNHFRASLPCSRPLLSGALASCFTLPILAFAADGASPTYNVNLGESEYNERGVKTYSLKLDKPNTAPQFKSVGLLVATEGEVLSLRLAASDDEGDALTYTLEEGPDSLAVSSDGLLQWAPDFNTAGKHIIRVSVSDGKLSTTGKWTMVVANTNRKPRITSKPQSSVTEMQQYSYTLTAEDADADEVSYRLIEAPKGMRMNGNRVLWTPDFSSAGSHSIVIEASDGQDTVQQSLSLKVINSNRAPVWQTKTLKTAKEGKVLTQQLLAQDDDQDQLSFTVAKGPQGMKLDDAGMLLWTPDFDDAGEQSVELLISDGEATIAKTFTMKVVNTNRMPSFAAVVPTAAKQAKEMELYDYAPEVTDPDADGVELTLLKAPKGMSLKDGRLSWTPDYQHSGEHEVLLEVSDGELKAQQGFVITVANSNRLPVWQTTELPGAVESQLYKGVLKASDADGDAVIYKLDKGPAGLMVSDTGVIEWQPGYDHAGSHQLLLTANDGQDSSAITLTVSVKNTNREPEFVARPPLMAAENAPYHYPLNVSDPDGDTLISQLIKGPAGMALVDGVLQWTPGYEHAGSYPVILEVADGDAKVQHSFSLQVSNTNRDPIFVPPAIDRLSLAENEDWQLPLQVEDADRDKLELSLSVAPDGMKLQGDTLHWKPSHIQAGKHKVRIAAADAEAVAYLSLDLIVENTNRVPELLSPALLVAQEEASYEYEVSARDADIIEDKTTTEVLSYKLLQGPEGMAFSANRLLWTPSFEQAGEHLIKIEVSDGSLSVQQAFKLVVENTNRAPVFDTEAMTSVLENDRYEYVIDIMDYDGDEISLTLESAPQAMTLDGRTLSWQTGFKDAGEYPVTLKVSDGDLHTLQTFVLAVENNNRLPEFTSKPAKVAHENVEYRYQIKVKDADQEELGLILLQGPEGMELKSAGIVSWKPAFNQYGKHMVKISASDGIDTQEQVFTVTVVDTNREPTLAKVANQQVVVGKKFRYQLQASDVDGSDLTYSLVHAPEAMELSDSGKLYWKTRDKDMGKHTIIVSVSDGDLKVRRYFDIQVVEKQ